MSTIQDRVIGAISDSACVDRDKIKPESSLEDDLGMDSLDKMEAVIRIEDELGAFIPDERLETVKTVQDVIDLVQEVAGATDCASS